ncbi:UNVERIFIED_CONTAM: hypothetical protein FKN15_070736 [Acipenser sinensis]
MDRNALAELLQALESRRDAEERRREERYTALIERTNIEAVQEQISSGSPLGSDLLILLTLLEPYLYDLLLGDVGYKNKKRSP